ncbi:transporter [Alteromonas sediminis]|uniref:Transporter n=1 Tax=Alteromonas sediminis TaxID=2259342 RepID=A0A3N5Y3H6_9ALTE|nr:TolC family protein [Alteromonas sediminis]RPJ68472.1 transporter [Alteromonas sediminis]
MRKTNLKRASLCSIKKAAMETGATAMVVAISLFGFSIAKASETPQSLSLAQAVHLAQSSDDWLVKSQQEEQRLIALSSGATALPDPTFSLGLMNVPTDSFAFDQEPMTQLKVGASQMFPRGDTLSLQGAQYEQAAAIQPFMRDDRRHKVKWQASLLWLDAYQSQASHALVNQAKPLFDKLGEIVSASYASSVGSTKQQDIIRAELELVRLQDRLVSLSTAQQAALHKLTQYLYGSDRHQATIFSSVGALPSEQAHVNESMNATLSALMDADDNSLLMLLNTHPLVVATNQKIRAESMGIEIAEQAYKPQFGVNASYALRDDSRADFFSVGMSVSVPLFSTSRQDAQVSSTIAQMEASKTQKRLLLRELIAGLKSNLTQYRGASERLVIYKQQILPQMSQQAEAALNAYTNDTGDFAEVVRARIAELDASVTAVNIEVSKRKALAAIEYYLSSHPSFSSTSGVSHHG